MNTVDKFFELKPGMEIAIPAQVTILAEQAELESLRAQGIAQLESAHLIDLHNATAAPLDRIDTSGIVVLQVDPQTPGSFQRLSDLRLRMPDTPVVAALRSSDLTTARALLKQGVTDIVALPFEGPELVETLLEVASQVRNREVPAKGQLIGLIRGSGGIGATTVLTNLAAELGDRLQDPWRVCLMDLDLQAGDAASYLGVAPATGMRDLFDAGPRIDASVLRDASIDTGHGFRLLAPPSDIEPLEQVDIDQLLRAIVIARQQFDYVLVDLPANWTNWSLSVALACSRILFLTDARFASLRQTKRRIDLLQSMDVPRERIGVVVNRVEKKLFQSVGTEQIAETLRSDVVATLAADAATLESAHDQATTARNINQRSRFARDVETLADLILRRED